MGVIHDRWAAYKRQQILDQLALVPSDLPGAMATDAEVSAAIATLASTTATEAELAAAVATVNTTLASKQDAAAAATALALKAPLASPAFTGAPTKNGSPVQSATDVSGAFQSVFTPLSHGAGRTQTEINQALVDAGAGGRVLVRRTDGPWTIRRNVVGQQKSGGILPKSNTILEFEHAELVMADNCDFLRAQATLGTQVTITADTVITDDTVTVTSSASFTAGMPVFLRLGQASYDAAEPAFWLYATVLAVPDSTHVQIDRPLGYALSVAATPTVSQRSIAPITTPVENIRIEGVVRMTNPETIGVNAEAGISVQYARNVHIEEAIGTNCGSGVVLAQFVEGMTIGTVRALSANAQSGQGSKGRVLSLAECRGVEVDKVIGENFENNPIVFEGRCEAVHIGTVVLDNNFPGRSVSSALIATLGDCRVQIDNVHLRGAGSTFHAAGGTVGNDLRVGTLYCESSTRPTISDLSVVEKGLFVDGVMYAKRRTWRKVIPLTPNMAGAITNAPAGYLRSTRVWASTTTGITSFKLGCTAALTNELVTELVAGQTVAPSQGRGFGPPYGASSDPGKRISVSTNSTVPNGAYLVVEMDYFADVDGTGTDAGLDALVAPGVHASAHRFGGSDDLLLIPAQDSLAVVEPLPAFACGGRPNNVSGTVHLDYFTANAAPAMTKVTCSGGSVAAVGTTLARMGLYTVAANGDLTLVARTASDTTILGSAGVPFIRAFDATGGYPTSYTLVPGQRYAIALVMVGMTTAGNYQGITGSSAMFGPPPGSANDRFRAGAVTGQTDLPTAISVGSVVVDGSPAWLRLSVA